MDDQRKTFRYRVCGFGNHVEQKTVKFVERLGDLHTCSWCGVVPAYTICLPCYHVVCEECMNDADKAAVTVCWIDKQNLGTGRTVTSRLRKFIGVKIVHCTNVDSGCDYTGRLESVDNHLRESCAWYLMECFKCGESVVYKHLVNHLKTCKGVAGVLLRPEDGQSLLDDIRNASTELQQASTSTTSEVRDALGMLTAQLESIRRQLEVNSEGREDNVALNECNQ